MLPAGLTNEVGRLWSPLVDGLIRNFDDPVKYEFRYSNLAREGDRAKFAANCRARMAKAATVSIHMSNQDATVIYQSRTLSFVGRLANFGRESHSVIMQLGDFFF